MAAVSELEDDCKEHNTIQNWSCHVPTIKSIHIYIYIYVAVPDRTPIAYFKHITKFDAL